MKRFFTQTRDRLMGWLAPQQHPQSATIATYTGKIFDPFAPDARLIDLRDIAHGLSNVCWYNGQTARFYSVAEHSFLVCLIAGMIAEAAGFPADEILRVKRWALIHDATEAYLGDVPSPIKKLPAMQPYRDAEARLARLLAAWFGLDGDQPPWDRYG